jgi:hypothetical protein
MPEGWGDPSKEETYRKQPFRRTVQIREWFTKELSAVKSEVIGLAFDVEAITTEEMEQIGKNIPAVMAKYTKRTPKTWGTPVTEDTFLDLRYPVYVAAMALFKEAIEDLGKN